MSRYRGKRLIKKSKVRISEDIRVRLGFIVAIPLISILLISSSTKDINTYTKLENDTQSTPVATFAYKDIHMYTHKPDIISMADIYKEKQKQVMPEIIPPVEEEELSEEQSVYDVPLDNDLKLFIENVARYYGFEPDIIYKVISVESNFHIEAKNSAYYGLMQIGSSWWWDYQKWNDDYDYITPDNLEDFDPYNPYQNVVVGVRMLKYWQNEAISRGFYDIRDALGAYNIGFDYFSSPESYTRYHTAVMSRVINIIEE